MDLPQVNATTPRRRPAAAFGSIAGVRGVLRLAVDGIQQVTHIAEGLHANIATIAPPLGRARERRAPGIAGFVYGTVRTGTALAGSGADRALEGVQALLRPDSEGSAPDSPGGLATRSALNGVLGDHLARTGNPLALPMQLIARGAPGSRLLLLVHGLGMNDLQWNRAGHDHGRALAERLGCTPVYARYNTGRHVSENGAELALQLERLVAEWPVPVESLAIIGHSMGGLVARSAVHQGRAARLAWTKHLRQMVFLGTPHHGAPLERGGNWLHTVLGWSPYLAPFTRLARLRSDGITDLRHGNLLAGDWQGGRFEHRDTRTMVPLPRRIACYAVAGALGKGNADDALGDGLVTVASALGRHARPTHDLHFPAARTWIARGVHHLDLLNDPAVYAKLLAWLR
jgi:hypothetical protein